MRDSTTRHRRIMFWMTLSVAVHGIVVSRLPFPATTEPLVDKRTLWVSAWRNAVPFTPTANPAGRHKLSRVQTPFVSNDRSSSGSRSQPISLTRGDNSSIEEAETVPEDKIANHITGLIRSSIQEHFMYPPFAQRQGWEGEVLVALQLSAEGEIRDIRVIRSSGYRVLDEDALLILRRIGSIPNARTWLHGRQYSALIPIIYRLTG